MYTERQLISNFNKHLKNYPKDLPHTCAIEFKYIKGKTLNIKNHVQSHQIPSLIKTQYSQLFYKISDQSIGLKPFDSFFLRQVPAYLAVCFQPPPRQPKIIRFMEINVLVSLQMSTNKLQEADFKKYEAFNIKL